MLVAKINGKTGGEDLFTSAVFGHLRYIPPSEFWGALFAKAKGADANRSLPKALGLSERGLIDYYRLKVDFWPKFRGRGGEPDIILRFFSERLPTLVIVIEVKPWDWSHKSGEGEYDQLARYLAILGGETSGTALGAVIYLTTKNAARDLEATLETNPREREKSEKRLFSLQWQDVVVVAEEAAAHATSRSKLVLGDVAEFLRKHGLVYFDGFHECRDLDPFPIVSFYAPMEPMQTFPQLEMFAVQKAGWMR